MSALSIIEEAVYLGIHLCTAEEIRPGVDCLVVGTEYVAIGRVERDKRGPWVTIRGASDTAFGPILARVRRGAKVRVRVPASEWI